MGQVKPGKEAVDVDALLAMYEVIGQRRTNYDQMGWQTPALSFAAQAFLFSIALAPDAARVSRVLAATLALITSAASIQLMRKHLHLELVDALILEKIESATGTFKEVGLQEPPHGDSATRVAGLFLRSGAPVSRGWLERRDSPYVWTLALALFGLAAVVVVVLSILTPEVLS